MTKTELKRRARVLYHETQDTKEAKTSADVYVDGFCEGYISTLRNLILAVSDTELKEKDEFIEAINELIEEYNGK